MFINRLSSSDKRFKTLNFRDGLNILVADRDETSEQGDSRNGTGKSSVIRILRFVLGGNLAEELKSDALSGHSFSAVLNLPTSTLEGTDLVSVSRSISPSTRVHVQGWSLTSGQTDLHVDEWRQLLSRWVFQLPPEILRPTSGQLWGQLIRTYFGNPTKSHAAEPDWETGVKLGYFLGLAPEILGKAGDIDKLTKQRKAIRSAVREGAITHLSLDEGDLRAQVATARRRRDRVQSGLRSFRVDEQYAEHQRIADQFSSSIQSLNDEAIGLLRRERELSSTLSSEIETTTSSDLTAKLNRMYEEIGLVLPDLVTRRFDEVAEFHESVVRNRQTFLQDELDAVQIRLNDISDQRTAIDEQRAEVMRLLSDSVALDTFLDAQRSLAQLEAATADLERRLESALAVNEIDTTIKIQTAETVAGVRLEMKERSASLEGPIALFDELGGEIYADRDASLLISVTPKGILQIRPRVTGDASDGIQSVETFLLDMVCVVSALAGGRSPGILVHDSHLFDSIDGRQVASCLNIGARLSEQSGFQYIVTMNSDFLGSVQSEGAFDAAPYELDIHLTDTSEAGGLFGFRYE
jgi:uncharacterized protein YydD (DUF2326 family)